MYHPIVAVGEAGDILDLRLREGQVHTADGGLEFVLERAERHLCGNSAVGFDAGYPGEPRAWVCESSYRAGSWSRSRRVVQVVVERPGELIPRCFWLLTSMSSEEMSGEDL